MRSPRILSERRGARPILCYLAPMRTPQSKIEDARQWAMTIRLLFVVGALAGLVACVLVSRLL
jgi:hypothetical protein